MCDPDSAADVRYDQAPWERKTLPALGTTEPTQWVFQSHGLLYLCRKTF